MHIKRPTQTLVAICFLPASAFAMNLTQAVEYALIHAPTVMIAAQERSIKKIEQKSAFAKLLPSLDLATTNGLENNIPLSRASLFQVANPDAPWASAIKFGITQKFYDNGRSWIKKETSDFAADLADIRYLKIRDMLIRDIALEYYQYSLARRLTDVREQQQEIMRRQFETMMQEYEQGLKTKNDYLRFKAQLQRSEIELLSAINKCTQSTIEIRRLIGSMQQEDITFEPLPVIHHKRVEDILSQDVPPIEKTYDYKIAAMSHGINTNIVRMSERSYWPNVFLESSAMYNNKNYINAISFGSKNALSYTLLLRLEYNIWDWGIRRNDVAIATSKCEIQETKLQKELIESQALLANLSSEIIRIRPSFELSHELLALEEKSTANLRNQYREGKVSFLDLVTGLNNLLDAKIRFFTSYFDAQSAYTKYTYLEGSIYESIFQKTE